MSVALVCCGVQFPDSTVQCTAFTGGGVQYSCGVACSAINAGDPVSLICQETGALTTTFGYGVRSCFDNGGFGSALLKFSDNCFATFNVVQAGGIFYNPSSPTYYCGSCSGHTPACCYTQIGCICVRAHTIGPGGQIVCTTCVSLTCNTCVYPTGLTMPVLGCSGTTGAFLTWFSCPTCNAYLCAPCGATSALLETFLCYCTTTCTISLIRQCAGSLPGCSCNGQQRSLYFPYKTPDGKYLMTFIFSYPCTCCNYCIDCLIGGFPCSCIRFDLTVKATTDSVCYLGTSCATSCTVPLNSIFPATCAMLGTGGLVRCLCCTCNAPPCHAGLLKSFAPFSYGPDGWLLMHFDVCNTSSICFATCLWQRYWGIKPIGDQCYAMTCNYIQPELCGILSVHSSCDLGCAGYGFWADAGYIWDQGDCIKRQFIQTVYGCSNSCGQSPGLQATSSLVCFQVGAGPCLCYLGTSSYNRACCLQCYNQIGSNFLWTYLCCGTPQYYNLACNPNFYNNPCASGPAGQGTRIWFTGVGYYLNSLYLASIPYCYQCGCYYIATTEYAAAGMETSICQVSAFCNSGLPIITCTNYCCFCAIFSCVGLVRGAFNSAGLATWTCQSNFTNGVPNIFRVDCCFTVQFCCSYSGVCYFPALFKSNTAAASFSNIPSNLNGQFCSIGSSSYNNSLGSAPTINQFIGIAQNSATTGGTICYATAGMLDTSPFAQKVACLVNCGCYGCYSQFPCGSNILPPGTGCCSGSAILGFYTPMILAACGFTCWCYSCLNNAITYIMCPTTSVLFNGFQCDCFRFTYYGNDNLRFIPRYDTGLGKWTSTFDTHCKNFYCCCIVYTLCGTPCCSFNFNN